MLSNACKIHETHHIKSSMKHVYVIVKCKQQHCKPKNKSICPGSSLSLSLNLNLSLKVSCMPSIKVFKVGLGGQRSHSPRL